jgi:thymidylate synthase
MEQGYLDLLKDVLDNGIKRNDRTNVGTLSIFGAQMKFDLSKGYPLITTKRIPWKMVLKELLWIVRGKTDAKILQDQGVHIWDGNTSREFLDDRGLHDYPEGDVGPLYGFQFRHWGAKYINCHTDYTNQGIDQLANVINEIKTNPTSRRLLISAWNVEDLDKMSLNPCHTLCQFYVDTNKGTLSCQLYQRSGDLFLGVPFNIASYSALVFMIAKLCNLKPGTFIHTIGDAHIYNNHITQVKLQLQRKPFDFPILTLKDGNQESVEDFKLSDFELENYLHHDSIKAPMAI